MDRSRLRSLLPVLFCLTMVLPSTGCLHQLVATGIYFLDGGNLVDAHCDALADKRVVVFCRPPSASEYSHAGASRDIAKRVSQLLEKNEHVKIEVVDPREVDSWLDENDSNDFKALGQAVEADIVVQIELDHFDLYKGKTLYQGNADITVAVYDMRDNGRRVWDSPMGELRFPVHSGIPLQDKPVRQFQREFVEIVSQAIARNFYKHDPHADFAIDALANR